MSGKRRINPPSYEGRHKFDECIPFGDVVRGMEQIEYAPHTLRVYGWHMDDLKRIWDTVGTSEFRSKQIIPPIPSKVLNEYKNRNYISSTRPEHGVEARTRIWKLTADCVKVCKRNFGVLNDKTLEETTQDTE